MVALASCWWFGLIIATVLSWFFGSWHAFDGWMARALTTAAIIAVAPSKVRYVGVDLMELRHAPQALRLAFDAWVLGVYGCCRAVLLPLNAHSRAFALSSGDRNRAALDRTTDS